MSHKAHSCQYMALGNPNHGFVDLIGVVINIQWTSQNRMFSLRNGTNLCSDFDGSDFGHSGCSVHPIIRFEIFSAKLDHYINIIYFYDPKNPKRSSLVNRTNQTLARSINPTSKIRTIRQPNHFEKFGFWRSTVYIKWSSLVSQVGLFGFQTVPK